MNTYSMNDLDQHVYVWTDAAGDELITWDRVDSISDVYGIETVADVLEVAGEYFPAVA